MPDSSGHPFIAPSPDIPRGIWPYIEKQVEYGYAMLERWMALRIFWIVLIILPNQFYTQLIKVLRYDIAHISRFALMPTGMVSHLLPWGVLILLRLRQSFFVYCRSS